jgi:hypothetical protein
MGSKHTNATTQGQGREMDPTREMDRRSIYGLADQPTDTGSTGWNDRSEREMGPGDETRPAQPGGTRPLERDQAPANQKR